MDDIYRINVEITEFREAYNTGDIDRLLAVLHDDFVDMSEEFTSGFGATAKAKLRTRFTELIADYSVKFVPIIIDIVPAGNFMFDFGWHEFTLAPKLGGEVIQRRHRYFQLWQKDSAGAWKIKYFMNNFDVAEVFNGQKTRWFRSEDHPRDAAVQ